MAAPLCLALLTPAPAGAQSCTAIDFQSQQVLGVSAKFVFVTDTNGDGKLDVVAVADSVTTLPGHGDGTFDPGITTVGPSAPDAAVIGFFNADGRPDLAIAAGTNVHVLLGNGAGFDPSTAPSPYAVGATVKALATIDADRDGKLDLLVAELGGVQWLRGNGDGTFVAPAPVVPLAADALRVADFNGDGNPDLALLVLNDVRIALGDGAGGFNLQVTAWSFLANAQDLAVADFDRDGRVDIAVVSRSPGKKIQTRLGLGNGTFGARNDTALSGNNPVGLMAANLNGDEKPDAVITLQGSGNVESQAGLGNGFFTSLATVPYSGSAPTGQGGGDLNGDGLDDIVVAAANNLYVVMNTTGADCVRFLAVTSTGQSGDGQNLLQWVNPPGTYPFIHITWNTGAGCVPPAIPGGGTGTTELAFGLPGAKRSFPHTGLALDTPVCYAVFVKKTAAPTFSGSRAVKGRPFDSSVGNVRWAYSTGATSVAPPSIGGGGVVVASDDRLIHSVERGALGGKWPSAWTPFPLGGPAQSRSPVARVTVGSAGSVAIVGAQDGYVYLLNAGTGARLWPSPPSTPALGAGIQGAPAAMFRGFGGAFDYVLVGTRNPTADNAFLVLSLATGSVLTSFTNGGGATSIGPVNSGAAVDYLTNRVYFTSRAGGSPNTLWCFELGASPTFLTLKWAKTQTEVGEFDASPVLRGGRVYVASLDGRVHSMDALDGSGLRTFSTGDGPVKGFVFPDRRNDRVFFATNRRVWGLADTASGFQRLWNEVDLPSVAPADPLRLPSTLLYAPGADFLYVGGGDGRLWQLDTSLATLVPNVPPVIASVALGDGASAVGAPSRDGGFTPALVYVGTTAGVIYAVEVPFP